MTGKLCVTGVLLSFVILLAMESSASPSIASFVIRFVVDEPSSSEETHPSYRGTIRHIQTNQELTFSTWENAVEFIQRYVPLETQSGQERT